MLVGVVSALGVAVETASSVSGGLGRSAFRAEKRLKSITIVVTGLVERLRAKHVQFSLKISAIKAKIVKNHNRKVMATLAKTAFYPLLLLKLSSAAANR